VIKRSQTQFLLRNIGRNASLFEFVFSLIFSITPGAHPRERTIASSVLKRNWPVMAVVTLKKRILTAISLNPSYDNEEKMMIFEIIGLKVFNWSFHIYVSKSSANKFSFRVQLTEEKKMPNCHSYKSFACRKLI
jgi:hypothetical protein